MERGRCRGKDATARTSARAAERERRARDYCVWTRGRPPSLLGLVLGLGRSNSESSESESELDSVESKRSTRPLGPRSESGPTRVRVEPPYMVPSRSQTVVVSDFLSVTSQTTERQLVAHSPPPEELAASPRGIACKRCCCSFPCVHGPPGTRGRGRVGPS